MRQERIARGDLRDFTYRSPLSKISNEGRRGCSRRRRCEKPLEVTTVWLEGPRKGEVLVEIKATGVYHTDEFTYPDRPDDHACDTA
jgi:hypothetical protein